jgi:Amt family ammonium transporter
MAGNWILGGGWLANLGTNLNLGHGYIDPAGVSTAALIGGLTAGLGIALFGRRLPRLPADELPRLPPVQLPVLAMLGASLAAIGAGALVGANPSFRLHNLSAPITAANLTLAAAGGAFMPALYTWFTTGRSDALMASRGVAAALLAAWGVAPFAPPWAVLALGVSVGLLVPLATFAIAHLLRLDDPTGALPIALLGGLLGALAPGLLADGRFGQGWNGIGADAYLGVGGQGVTGYLPALGLPGPYLAADWPGQMNAQLVGLVAITALTVGLMGALLVLCKVLLVAWHSVPSPTPEPRVSEPEPVAPSQAPVRRRLPPRAKHPPRPTRRDRPTPSGTPPPER